MKGNWWRQKTGMRRAETQPAQNQWRRGSTGWLEEGGSLVFWVRCQQSSGNKHTRQPDPLDEEAAGTSGQHAVASGLESLPHTEAREPGRMCLVGAAEWAWSPRNISEWSLKGKCAALSQMPHPGGSPYYSRRWRRPTRALLALGSQGHSSGTDT